MTEHTDSASTPVHSAEAHLQGFPTKFGHVLLTGFLQFDIDFVILATSG